VIAHKAAAVHEPVKAALNHPALGEEHEAGHIREALDDFQPQCGVMGLNPLLLPVAGSWWKASPGFGTLWSHK
jgi:hypothetical protein